MAKTFKLALDAGHGYSTPGRRCLAKYDPVQHREWVLNARICSYIAERAKDYVGFETYRVDDPTGAIDVDLPERCKRANSKGADLYYSAHHNAGVNGGKGGGVTAYCYYASAKGAQWRDLLYTAVVEAGGLRGNRAAPCGEAGFYVTKHTNMPAVLVEHGFMDSSTDIPIIISEDYARKVGYAVADAIAKQAGLELVKGMSYLARVTTGNLNVRSGPGTDYPVTGTLVEGEVLTIVEERKNGTTYWGKLRLGLGWISLGYTAKTQ